MCIISYTHVVVEALDQIHRGLEAQIHATFVVGPA